MPPVKELINRLAPDFILPTLGGGRLALSDLRGQVVVLNFWSAECPWSRRADVVLVYRHMSWSRKGVRIIGVVSNANESDIEVKHEAETRRVTYPLVLDAEQKVADLYRAEMTPHFFLIDRQGMIRYTGALDDADYVHRRSKVIYLDQAVNAVLENKAPSPPTTPPYGCAIVRVVAPEGGTAVETTGA
jgi:peroxiredoxin